ncbi:MAG: ATP-binding protein [Flavobacterium sp.]
MKEKLISILEKANEVRVNNLAQSIFLVEEVLNSSNIDNYIDLKARAFSQLSLYYMILGEDDKCMDYADKSIKLFEELGDEKGIADAKYSVAGVYYKTDNYHIGLVYLIDALNVYRKLDDYYNISRCEKSLGTIYDYSGDQNSALKSYQNAVLYAKKINDLNLLSNAYNNLSGLYIKQGNIELAEKTILESITLKTVTGDIRGMAFAIYGRAKVNLELKKYKEAKADFLEAIEIHSEMGERLGLAMCYHKMAKFYIEVNEPENAKVILAKGLELCVKYNISIIRFKSYHLLYTIYKQEGNKTAALEYLEKYIELKETVLNTQTLKVIDNYDMLVQMKTVQKEADFLREKAEMIEKTNRAEEAARVRQEFLSTMSHEIRTPLNAITTIASILGKKSNEEDKELIDSLNFSSNHLMQIINDILDFDKLDLGKMELELSPIPIYPLLEKIIEAYKFQTVEKNLDLSFKSNVLPTEIYYLDNMKITQIIGNLINNAIKFTDFGKVELEVNILKNKEKHDILEFRISDTGEGINSDNLDKIFETFSQVKNTITRKAGGTGLGLAIVKKLIELHGSTINVESIPGKGTQFYFELKLKKSKQSARKSENIHTINLEGVKVLLVEDNPINAMIAEKLLSQWSIITVHVSNGMDALRKIQDEEFDCILMDIHMPEMDGFEATEHIRNSNSSNKETPIFGLTADVSANTNKKYLSLFNGFLLKPIEIEKMKLALSSVK